VVRAAANEDPVRFVRHDGVSSSTRYSASPSSGSRSSTSSIATRRRAASC
jgi:hypothetical protein